TGESAYQPERWKNQPERVRINQSVEESTGESAYQSERWKNQPEREQINQRAGRINRRENKSTGEEA
uniref:hypothetical protein n=1 Tax=Virgibacillus alimentarius TaxID=698769 RepID=UPI0004937FC3